MYPVSESYMIQADRNNRFEHVRGTIGGQSFGDNNIIGLNYTNRNSDTSDISFGSVYIGQLQLSVTGINIPRGSWRGQVINLEYGLEFPDHSIEWIPIGVFKVVKAEWNETSISLTANDIIADLDQPFSITQTTGTVFDLVSLACQLCGIGFARTEQEIRSLPNGTELLSLYPNNDIKTVRDFIGALAQVIGGYATATRDGKLTLRSWNESQLVISLKDRVRIIGTVFSDYSTSYSGISIVNIEDQTTSYYSNESGVGSVINLGSNPLLQYGSNEVKTRQRQAIADVTEDMTWTPFRIALLNNPVYDLGDIVKCIGGVAGSEVLYCCIMDIDWSFKQTISLQGYGSDPALASAKSKTDKIISGLISKTSENEVIFHTFENAQDFELDDDVIEDLLTLRFATINPKIVNIWHEINLDVTADPLGDGVVECQAFYYLDDELISYSPVTTWDNDGLHLLHLMYFIQNLEGGTAHKWNVKLKVKGGTATIDVGDIHASLYGQGLVASDSWDGILDIFDEISLSGHGKATFGTLTENISFDWNDVESIDCADVISLIGHGKATFGTLADQVDIEVIKEIYNIVSEDKLYDIVSEDGLYNLESED